LGFLFSNSISNNVERAKFYSDNTTGLLDILKAGMIGIIAMLTSVIGYYFGQVRTDLLTRELERKEQQIAIIEIERKNVLQKVDEYSNAVSITTATTPLTSD
jgi:hypothetical protein